MSRTALVIAILSLVGLVGVMAWVTFRDEPPPGPGDGRVDPDPGRNDAARSAAARRDPEEIEDRSRDIATPARETAKVIEVPPSEAWAEIRGRVVAAEGTQPAGAEVYLAPAGVFSFVDPGFRARAGEDGAFTLRVSRQQAAQIGGDTADLIAGAPGFLPAVKADLALPFGGVSEVGDLVLARGMSIRGRVVDTDGRPVEGAGVVARREKAVPPGFAAGRGAVGWGGLARTDERGEYAVVGLAKESHRVAAEHAGYDMAGEAREAVPEAIGVDLVMKRLRVATGRVVSDRDERGIADATVRLEVLSSRGRGMAWIATTIEDGRFAFDLSGDEFSGEVRLALRVTAAGHADWAAEGLDLAPLLPGENYLVRLIPSAPVEPGRLRGRVIYDTGEPFKNGNITISFSKQETAGTTVSVWTDADGRFFVEEVPPGEYRMSTALHNQVSLVDAGKVLIIPPGGEETAEFVVRRGGDVEFKVRSATGQPLTGLKVERIVPDLDEVEYGRSGEDAEYFVDVAPGTHKFRVSAEGHRTRVVQVSVAKGLFTREEVVLEEER